MIYGIETVILVVVVAGFFTLAVAFGVTLTLTMHEPLESAFTEVPETEQNFFDFAATTSATLAPFGTSILAVLLIVAKVASLPFFIVTDFVPTDAAETVHGSLFTRTQIVCVAIAPVARMRYLVETVGQIFKVAFPFEPLVAVIIAVQPAFALALTALMARTREVSLTDKADTPPLAQMVVTLSVAATSPPCSQLEPAFTVSTD